MPMGVFYTCMSKDMSVPYIHSVGFCITYLITTGFPRTSNGR